MTSVYYEICEKTLNKKEEEKLPLKLFYISLAELYKVVVWTTDRDGGSTDGKVLIKFGGNLCMTDWNKLYYFLVNTFQKGDGNSFNFYNYDIGSKVN